MGDVDGGFPSVADTIAAVRRELGREPNAASRLAGSLNNLAVQLGAMGRWEEALAASQETVAIRRELAAARPDAFRPDLASSLNNLAAGLAALGRACRNCLCI